MTKRVSIGDFLTEQQLADVVALWNAKNSAREFHHDVLEQVIRPNISEINRKLGQENDPRYLAYMLEYACSSREAQ